MRAKIMRWAFGIPLLLAAGACSSAPEPGAAAVRREVTALRTEAPVVIDGKLDEAAWRDAPAHTLLHYRDAFKSEAPDVQEFFRNGVVEAGTIRLLWDDTNLYVGFELTDRDIVAEGDADQELHYRKGDTAEIFLKPAERSWYWELYVTPRGKTSAFFIPGCGLRDLPSTISASPALKGFRAAASYDGTPNDSRDTDRKWCAEAAIPRAELAAAGEKLDPGIPWLIFFGRYNYGRHLAVRENTAFPLLQKGGFHSQFNYGSLRLRSAPGQP